MTMHLVYVNEPGIGTTHAIAREVPQRLADRYQVKVYHPNDPVVIHPEPGDVLIGHPNRYGPCAFSRAFAQRGWARRIVFAPFSTGMMEDAAAIDQVVCEADLYLAITGPYWFDSVETSLVSHWRHKMLRCDLGVNRAHYPQIKRRFNPAGQRRFLYIGNGDPMKGGDFLTALADANPDIEFGWIATGDARHCLDLVVDPPARRTSRRMRASRLVVHDGVAWRQPAGLRLVETFDFILNCGRSDAMPCEVLEGASWGLLPVTTPQCGFRADDWMTHVPLDDVPAASAVLRELNGCPDAILLARQAEGFRHLDTRYNWNEVAEQVRDAIEMPIPSEPDDPQWRGRKQANQRRLRRILRYQRWSHSAGRAVDRVVRGAASRIRRVVRPTGRGRAAR